MILKHKFIILEAKLFIQNIQNIQKNCNDSPLHTQIWNLFKLLTKQQVIYISFTPLLSKVMKIQHNTQITATGARSLTY
jgi:hypothetical protein